MSAPTAASGPVQIRLFGALRVAVAEHSPVDRFPTQKIALALACLALHRGEPQSRESLGELLWPESDPAAQRGRLNTVVYNLRRILEPEGIGEGTVLATGRHQITLQSEGVWVDAREFEDLLAAAERLHGNQAMERAQTLEQAVALYGQGGGGLLPGFYEEEIVRAQERTERLCFDALLDLAAAWDATGREAAAKAIEAARRAVDLDPLSEAANLALIQRQANAGQRAAALQSYKRMETLFREEMNAAPPPALRELLRTLRPTAAPPAPAALLPNNIPATVTSFVGRDAESIEVDRLLSSGETRLLTLAGPGGVGKTRLALRCAWEACDRSAGLYPQGVWLVELAPLPAAADPPQVGRAIAAALGVREQPGEPIAQTLMEHFKSQRLLLVFDNCEHLVQAAAELTAAILRACPHVTLLTTSREPLGIGGETVLTVPPLALPAPDTRQDADSLGSCESVRLFAARARAVKPGFRVTERNAATIAQVCRRLDGLPLAIELAAARLRALTVEQVGERLSSRFPLLKGGDRTAQPRQQTLQALIDWSYDLLSPREKTLLARLSVFVGGLTLPAAEGICADDVASTEPSPEGGISESDVLDLLTSLTDKSLVQLEQVKEEEENDGQAARYRMLETVRQYAAEKLRDSGEDGALATRHLHYFTTWAEEAAVRLTGAEQEIWLNRLESDHDNLRAALDASAAPSVLSMPTMPDDTPDDAARSQAGLRLTGALWRFWLVRGYLTEGRERLDRALSARDAVMRQETEEPTAARRAIATALRASGHLAWNQGDYRASQALLEESLEWQLPLDDSRGVASTLSSLGLVANKLGDYPAAQSLLTESLDLCRAIENKNGIASALSNLALVAYNQADYTVAYARYTESLVIDRELGDKAGIADTLMSLGNVAFDQDDLDAARSLYQESLELSREIGDKHSVANTLGNLSNITSAQDDLRTAREQLEECLAIHRELGDKAGVAVSLGNLGSVAVRLKDFPTARALHEESLRLSGAIGDQIGVAYGLEGVAKSCEDDPAFVVTLRAAAQTLRAHIGAPHRPSAQAQLDDEIARIRAAIGDTAFQEAWDAGCALSWQEAAARVGRKQDVAPPSD